MTDQQPDGSDEEKADGPEGQEGLSLAGDLARRIARRRTELGMSVEDLAKRAGVDPVYLHYFEANPQATLSAGTLQLMALALETTPLALLGGEVDRPPGHGRAGRHPVLEVLTRQQCEAHLAVGGVGRIVYSASRGPVALPVNFEFTEGEIVFSTNESKAATIGGQTVSQRLSSLDLEAWAGGSRHSLVAIMPDEITGRVIIHDSELDED